MRSNGQFATAPSSTLCGAFVVAAIFAGALTMIVPATAARPSTQDQQPPSLGEIARRLRTEKQQPQASAKVWTNDNLPKNPFGVSVVGPPPPPPDEKPAADDTKAGEKPDSTAKPNSDGNKAKTLPELEDELAQAQKDLDLQAKQVDLAKRDFTLQQQAFYTNPMANQDEAGQAQLAEAQKQIDALQVELDKATAHVAELQAKVDEMKKSSPASEPAPKPDGSTSGN